MERNEILFHQTYSGVTASVGPARSDAARCLASVDLDADAVDAAKLIVSELAVNAVNAAPGERFHLMVWHRPDVHTVLAVTNRRTGDDRLPPRDEWGPDELLSTSGRGLAIVDRLAKNVIVDDSDDDHLTVAALLPAGQQGADVDLPDHRDLERLRKRATDE